MSNVKLVELTVVIVANYVTGNHVAAGDLPALIDSVYAALADVETPTAPPEEPGAKLTAAQIRKSLTDGSHLISFIDGKPYRLLKRHLKARGMTPDEYRAKFGLPANYPIVSPNYSAARSKLAVELGLGKRSAAEKRAKYKAK